MYFIVPVQVCVSRRVCTGLTKFNRDKIVQITEVLLAVIGGSIRGFIQQAWEAPALTDIVLWNVVTGWGGNRARRP